MHEVANQNLPEHEADADTIAGRDKMIKELLSLSPSNQYQVALQSYVLRHPGDEEPQHR